MAKTGKISMHISEYDAFKHYAPLLQIEPQKISQIGSDVNIEIKYKDVNDVYKLGKVSHIKPQQPQNSGADKKPDTTKNKK